MASLSVYSIKFFHLHLRKKLSQTNLLLKLKNLSKIANHVPSKAKVAIETGIAALITTKANKAKVKISKKSTLKTHRKSNKTKSQLGIKKIRLIALKRKIKPYKTRLIQAISLSQHLESVVDLVAHQVIMRIETTKQETITRVINKTSQDVANLQRR